MAFIWVCVMYVVSRYTDIRHCISFIYSLLQLNNVHQYLKREIYCLIIAFLGGLSSSMPRHKFMRSLNLCVVSSLILQTFPPRLSVWSIYAIMKLKFSPSVIYICSIVETYESNIRLVIHVIYNNNNVIECPWITSEVLCEA